MNTNTATAAPDNGATPRQRNPAANAVINGIHCDPATAELVYTATAGHDCFTGDGFRRFDEVLYRAPDGYWFLVRPLAPDEAREWVGDPRHDSILAKQFFPDMD